MRGDGPARSTCAGRLRAGRGARVAGVLGLVALAGAGRAGSQDAARIRLTVDASQAHAVLTILDRRAGGATVRDEDWHALWAAEPYRRLKQREAALGRGFTDEEFRRFVLSEALAARAGALRRTLDDWQRTDLGAAARRILGYLPDRARIDAKVFPVIKPQVNSFVVDLGVDPAVFLYLDPALGAAAFEHTVAHELHHIGFGSLGADGRPDLSGLGPPARTVVEWLSAFGEGVAMLAAAGSPDAHPHATGPAADRARWDRDVGEVDRHLGLVQAFFLDVLDGRLNSDEAVRRAGMALFGEQGPWYTVGWVMAVTVERRYGREALVECLLDMRRLLVRYNTAAGEANRRGGAVRALWSPDLLRRIGALEPPETGGLRAVRR